ncbi:MAG: GNAT family N-acetyltransferase [Myxococcota bacterium]
MSSTISVCPFSSHEWRIDRDLRLRALSDSPDAFMRTLEEEEGQTDAFWSERIVSAAESDLDLLLLAKVDSDPAGLSCGKIPTANGEVAHVFQMWVVPTYRGVGVALKLLDEIASWATSKNARRLVLSVTCGDSAANRLYARMGFAPVGEPEPLRPGSALLSQEMHLDLTNRKAR